MPQQLTVNKQIPLTYIYIVFLWNMKMFLFNIIRIWILKTWSNPIFNSENRIIFYLQTNYKIRRKNI